MKKMIESKMVWNLCMEDNTNLPEESGTYLVILPNLVDYKLLPFFKKGDVMKSTTFMARGITANVIAEKDSFYQADEGSLKDTYVAAWAKLPEDVNDVLNMFIGKSDRNA